MSDMSFGDDDPLNHVFRSSKPTDDLLGNPTPWYVRGGMRKSTSTQYLLAVSIEMPLLARYWTR